MCVVVTKDMLLVNFKRNVTLIVKEILNDSIL